MTDVKKILERLKEIKKNGPKNQDIGICANLGLGMHWLEARFEEWPEFSGNLTFPVTVPGKDPEDLYCVIYKNLWDRSTEYGQARYRLLDFLIQQAETELNQNNL